MDDLVERALPQDVTHGTVSSVKAADAAAATRVPTSFSFFVLGRPVAKGSKSIWRGRVVEGNKGLYEWSKLVADTAAIERAKRHRGRNEGPCTVLLDFTLPKPQRPKHSAHITKPDLDKLARAVLDALTGQIWYDDAQVDKLILHKHYGEPTGVTISVVGSTS